MLAGRTGGIVLTLLLSAATASASPPTKPTPPPRGTDVTLRGQVVPLAEALSALGLKSDPESLAGQVVLKEADGTITPLLADDASRALFKDERLRRRKTELHGRRFAKLPYLQVVTFQVEEAGRMRTPEYFCDVCIISLRFPQICPCCQGDMYLRMKPEHP